MNQLFQHNNDLKDIIENGHIEVLRSAVDLDSIDLVLRECLSLEEMREAGSFFTGQNLATKLIKSFNEAITLDSVVLDPTCGAGNLLIECSRMLGVHKNLSCTLKSWGKVLQGYDLHSSFVEATKLRLVIEALNRGVKKDCSVEQALSYFTHIQVKDTLLVCAEELKEVTHVVLNPPFSSWISPQVHYWKKGKVNAAGLIMDHYLRNLPKGCLISAILPDVLRSGSRYDNFRQYCSSQYEAQCSIWGRFNKKTDVDVFLLIGKLKAQADDISIQWQEKDHDQNGILSDYFDVSVGPLVAYRDPLIGKEYAYFHSKNTTAWEVLSTAAEKRNFKGRVIQPPCILVKRTSSPGDKYRATATIIDLQELIAVENHLMVIKPKSNSLLDCKKLMKILQSKETNEFLNKAIRLRHLTVQVLKNIPYY